MRKRFDTGIKPSEITPESAFLNRPYAADGAVAAGLVPSIMSCEAATIPANGEFADVKKWPGSTTEKANTFEEITTYNNYYEFGTRKRTRPERRYAEDEAVVGRRSPARPSKPGDFTLEDILKPHALEERIYRLRCVEAWSMVIPWVGFPLADLLKRFEPTSQREVRRSS